MTSTIEKPELAPARSLMDRVLRDGEPIAPEFPLVFREGFPGKVVSLGDEGAVRSACTVLIRDLVCPGASLRAGLIGSVSTDPEFRRQGLASIVLDRAEKSLADEGAAVSILWADDPRFYFARGYRPVGCEQDFVIAPETAAILPEAEGVRAMESGDAGAIHALYIAHEARAERTGDETAALLECPDMEVLVCEDEGRVVAYACQGRGRDLVGTVHEWGGDPLRVLGLVRALAERHTERTGGEPTFLIAPAGERELSGMLRGLGVVPTVGLLGLAKVVDRGRAAGLLDLLLGPEAEVTFDPKAELASQVHLRAPGGTAFLNDDTLLVLLLSTRGEREDTVEFGRHFGVDVSRLPLEPFLWGLDSI